MIGDHWPAVCPVEPETLPLQVSEPSAGGRPQTSARPKWLPVTVTPAGSPLRSQALTGCPVESHTFPDHTFPGPLGSNAATGPQ
jgi:hypothetical protein